MDTESVLTYSQDPYQSARHMMGSHETQVLLVCVPFHQVQLLTAPASMSHRHLQGKGAAAPETSLLMGAVPAQGAPGEQGPAGRCLSFVCAWAWARSDFINIVYFCSGVFVLMIESAVIHSFLH